MDFTTPVPYEITPQIPVFSNEAAQLATNIAKLSQPKLTKLLLVSPAIASVVYRYYQDWDETCVGRPALWTYTGDVYKGVKAQTLSEADADWAQQHLLISSGLYGLVRPFDGIQAYRLEMKSSFQIERATSLNEFWGGKLSQYVDGQGDDWLCNLSSEEYARVVTRHTKLPVITPVFLDTKPTGAIGQVPIYSKMMRGVMARWMIDKRIRNPEQLTKFGEHKYSYDSYNSKPGFPAFRRQKMIPLRFD